jgi:hypothetical protein
MTSLIERCRWPDLAANYAAALRDAVELILDCFDPLGIVACGTIIRGQPRANSDLDIYVIHAQPQRQRLQRRCNGVPVEIFVNPVSAVASYFMRERAAGRPLTAHMLATGFVILARDPVIDRLCAQAREQLDTPPDYDNAALLMRRYHAATLFEDALDCEPDDLASANLIVSRAVYAMLQLRFMQANRYLPRDKDLFQALNTLDPHLAALALAFYDTGDIPARLALAAEMADHVLGARGFFEWESALEDV